MHLIIDKCQLGKTNWASKIRDILNGYGLAGYGKIRVFQIQ